MSAELIDQAVESRFERLWNDDLIPVTYENVNFDSTDIETWLRLAIVHGETTIVGMGGLEDSLHRTVGIIEIECFSKIGEGTRKLIRVAQLAEAVFDKQSFNGVRCNDSTISKQGEQDNWYKINVYIDFWYDEIKTIVAT